MRASINREICACYASEETRPEGRSSHVPRTHCVNRRLRRKVKQRDPSCASECAVTDQASLQRISRRDGSNGWIAFPITFIFRVAAQGNCDVSCSGYSFFPS